MTVAQPKPGTINDIFGTQCVRATKESYPLYAKCKSCNGVIRCADGTADWVHIGIDSIRCA